MLRRNMIRGDRLETIGIIGRTVVNLFSLMNMADEVQKESWYGESGHSHSLRFHTPLSYLFIHSKRTFTRNTESM